MKPHPSHRRNAFTLMEMVVVIAILALLAAVATPAYFKHLEKARRNTAKTQVKMLEQAVLQFQIDVGRTPAALDDLVRNPGNLKKWDGPYLNQTVLPKDPWGNDYGMIIPGAHGKVDIFSYGSDGQPGGEGADADIGNWPDPKD